MLALILCASVYVNEKAAAVEQSLRLLNEIAAMARAHDSHYPDEAMQAKIRKVLEPLKNVDDLRRFALMAHAAAGSQAAEHQNYDSVFDYAQWASLYRLAETPGEEARWALQYLKPILGADGHPSEEMSELIEKQRKLASP